MKDKKKFMFGFKLSKKEKSEKHLKSFESDKGKKKEKIEEDGEKVN